LCYNRAVISKGFLSTSEVSESVFRKLKQERNQNYIQEEIKGRLKSGNACYHSVQNLLSYSLLADDKIENNEMGGACSAVGGGERRV
jgi:hypothetical protein